MPGSGCASPGTAIESLEELRTAELPYDLILSGSDQIWNPKIFPNGRFDPVFFGAFSDQRKIAYAPSFGIPRIPEEMEEELAGVSAASFPTSPSGSSRARRIVRHVTGRDVPVVLDPTLLLDRRTVERPGGRSHPRHRTGGYILCYCISRPGALEPYIRRLAEETGLPVVQLCGIRQKVHPKAHCVLDAGPAEFLGWFQGASCGVHQLLPRDGVFRPVPKALLHRRGPGGAGGAGELPHLQPAAPAGPARSGSSARATPPD